MIHASTRPPRLRARLAAGLATAAIAIGGLALAPAAQAAPVADWAPTLGFVGAYDIDVSGDHAYAAARERGLYRATKTGTITPIVEDGRDYMGIAVSDEGDLYYSLDSDRTVYRIPAAALDGPDPVGSAVPYVTLPFGTPIFRGLAFDEQGRLYGAGDVYGTYDGVWTSETSILRIAASGSTAEVFRGSPRQDLNAFDFAANGDALLVNSWDGELLRLPGASTRQTAAGMGDLVSTGLEPGGAMGIAVVDTTRIYHGTRLLSTVPSVLTGTPTISGDRSVGGTLTAAPGDGWTEGASFTYRWLRDGEPIEGATASSYLLTAADRGTEVSVEVTGTLAGHSSSSTESDPTGPVFTGMLTPGTPSVSGELVVGRTLTGTTGVWKDGVALSYRWLREKTPIDGATGSSYTLTAADEGFTIALAVTGTLDGYNSETARIRTSAPVVAAPVVTPPVVTPPVVTPPVVAPPTAALPAPVVSVDDLVAVGGTLAGSEITVRGSGLAPGSAWSVWLRSTPTLLASGTADASGSFQQVVTLPSSVEPGAHRLIVRGLDRAGAAVESTVFVTVDADGTLGYSSSVRPEPAALPSTGADASGALLALALLLGGFGIVAARRRSAT